MLIWCFQHSSVLSHHTNSDVSIQRFRQTTTQNLSGHTTRTDPKVPRRSNFFFRNCKAEAVVHEFLFDTRRSFRGQKTTTDDNHATTTDDKPCNDRGSTTTTAYDGQSVRWQQMTNAFDIKCEKICPNKFNRVIN